MVLKPNDLQGFEWLSTDIPQGGLFVKKLVKDSHSRQTESTQNVRRRSCRGPLAINT